MSVCFCIMQCIGKGMNVKTAVFCIGRNCYETCFRIDCYTVERLIFIIITDVFAEGPCQCIIADRFAVLVD